MPVDLAIRSSNLRMRWVIDATTHNGMAHLAEFVQRDRDQMLVGIAVA